MPVPLKATEVGVVGALLGMETDPTFAPVEVGEKVTPKIQVPAGATVALLQVLLLKAKFPVMDKAPITRLAVPVLVTVKDLAVLVEPTARLPKSHETGLTLSAGAVVPVPLSETLFGDVLALLGMETEPTFAPADAGEKVTPKVQVPAGATVALLQVLLLNAKFPVMDRVPITRLAEPVLVTVKDFAVLVEPTA